MNQLTSRKDEKGVTTINRNTEGDDLDEIQDMKSVTAPSASTLVTKKPKSKDQLNIVKKAATQFSNRSTAEVAPWSEGQRHLNFSQRYREN